jgi:Na+/H+-dicarboxylate symporter
LVLSECDQSRCWNLEETIANLSATYEGNLGITSKLETAAQQNDAGPLQALVDMVPDNAVAAMSNNSLMLQVILCYFPGNIHANCEKGVTIKEFL